MLKLAASRLSSSVPLASIRSERSPVFVTFSVAPVSRRTGASAVRATARPRAAASAIPIAAMIRRYVRIRESEWSTSVSGRAIWIAKPSA